MGARQGAVGGAFWGLRRADVQVQGWRTPPSPREATLSLLTLDPPCVQGADLSLPPAGGESSPQRYWVGPLIGGVPAVPPALPQSASTVNTLEVPRPFVLFPYTHGHGHAGGSF